jgi:hypothetical protein
MPAAFDEVFASLKTVLVKHSKKLSVKHDEPAKYTLVSKTPSPFPQHKGEPMWFAEVRSGKAYVSFHLMPLYMNPALSSTISTGLKKRMQGKTCFNFKSFPDPEHLKELGALTQAALEDWKLKGWL